MGTIGERLRYARGDESRDSFAPKCGVSRSTLASYETGGSDPSASFLVKVLNMRPKINPLWLFLGEEPVERSTDPHPSKSGSPLNLSLLKDVLFAVEEHLDSKDLELVPNKKAELISILYEMFAEKDENKVDKAAVLRLVKLAA